MIRRKGALHANIEAAMVDLKFLLHQQSKHTNNPLCDRYFWFGTTVPRQLFQAPGGGDRVLSIEARRH
jgi:hypothetical protein